ncbi:MAG: cytochrome c3 family protein [Deltaproteobacteria bacterium]|nr:cytochrome c3 family protein [Deltaproteobacteria bacterium]MBW1952620.1 cytochrome c3 family protein [Deltaproteobacteria bacterium]MBW1986253.1 cytochrome c3 family protein [Deltaproteobacteria bacterium]MBW2134150.1 cytochrome c3 family protein [Deltaproteobacteria bacterium]
MRRKGHLWPVALFLIGNLGVIWAQASLPTEPQPQSLIQSPGLQPWQKPPVAFSHQQHEEQRIACATCHHEYDGGRNHWSQGDPVKKCQECHPNRPQTDRPDLKNAFHRQCKGCHLKLSQQGQRAGPIRCLDCHRQI